MGKRPKSGSGQNQRNPTREYRLLAKQKRTDSVRSNGVVVTQGAGASPVPQQPAALPTGCDADEQTLQQQRAKYALERVKATIEEIRSEQANEGRDPDGKLKEFRSYAASFPAMIQMNGLGQAAAFYFSQGETYRRLYTILSDWLIAPGQPYAGQPDLLEGITGQDMHSYRVARADALLLLDWVKRFAKAFVRED